MDALRHMRPHTTLGPFYFALANAALPVVEVAIEVVMASDPLQFLTATMTAVTPSAASLLTALLACCSPADRQSGSHY